MARRQGLQGRLQVPTPSSSGTSTASKTAPATKRKRDTISPQDARSDDERPRKKAAGKQQVVKAVADPRAENAKQAKKTYASIIKRVEKPVRELDGKCKAQGPNGTGYNSDDYAKAMVQFLPDVTALSKMDGGVKFAFDLMLYLGEHVHGDFYMCMKMCGYGDSVKPYKALDEVMLGLIERRKDEPREDNVQAAESISVPHRWTEADAHVGVYKTSRPNKQQRGQIARQRQEWTKERSEKAREKRETTTDWVSNALVELTEERDYLASFGLDGYFIKSIARLEELKSSTC
jgi:hypothetical protein